MFRLRELSEIIRELAPPVVTDAFAVITNLGDPLFLLAIIAVYYWLSDERDGPAQLIAFALLAVAVTVTLKNGIALPRPPASVQTVQPETGTHGFPSGHAIGATAVYGGLLAVDERLRRPATASALAALVGLVGLSRVVIGVHYLGDVLVGFAIGGVLLAGLWYSKPRHTLLVATSAALIVVPAVVFTGGDKNPLFVLGASIGALAGFAFVDPGSLPSPTASAGAVLAAVGLLVVVGTYSLAQGLNHPAAFVTAGVAVLLVSLSLPLVLRFVSVGYTVAD